MTKATTAEGDQVRYGPNWVTARRAILNVFSDRLECGDWKIEYKEIKDSVLYSIKTNLIIPGYVLKVATTERTYHFGLNAGSFWKGSLPFEVRREKGMMAYSPISIVARSIVLIAIAYWAYDRYLK